MLLLLLFLRINHQVTETHLLRLEMDMEVCQRTISLLCDDDLHQVMSFPLALVQLITVQYQHEVGVMFQETTAQLRNPGFLEWAALHGSQELCNHQDRNIEFSRDHFEYAADFLYLLHALLRAPAVHGCLHEMDIIHNDEGDMLLLDQMAGPLTQLFRRQARSVIDPYACFLDQLF